MIGFAQILFAAAMAQPSHPAPMPTPAMARVREGIQRLDQCLIASAERLAGVDLTLDDKYAAYIQSCPAERAGAFQLALRHDLDRLPHQQRWSAFERAAQRVDSRFPIWVSRFLDPAPPQHSRTSDASH